MKKLTMKKITECEQKREIAEVFCKACHNTGGDYVSDCDINSLTCPYCQGAAKELYGLGYRKYEAVLADIVVSETLSLFACKVPFDVYNLKYTLKEYQSSEDPIISILSLSLVKDLPFEEFSSACDAYKKFLRAQIRLELLLELVEKFSAQESREGQKK